MRIKVWLTRHIISSVLFLRNITIPEIYEHWYSLFMQIANNIQIIIKVPFCIWVSEITCLYSDLFFFFKRHLWFFFFFFSSQVLYMRLLVQLFTFSDFFPSSTSMIWVLNLSTFFSLWWVYLFFILNNLLLHWTQWFSFYTSQICLSRSHDSCLYSCLFFCKKGKKTNKAK